MKRLMLGAVVAIAMACAGPAFAASPGGQSYDKEAKALVIVPAATAEVTAHTPAAPVSAKLDVIDKVELAAEKRASKPDDRSKRGSKGPSAPASQRSEPLLL